MSESEIERLRRERDDYRSKWYEAAGVANLAVQSVKNHEARLESAEAVVRAAEEYRQFHRAAEEADYPALSLADMAKIGAASIRITNALDGALAKHREAK